MRKLTEAEKRLREKFFGDLKKDFPSKDGKSSENKNSYGKSGFGKKGYGKS
jgi:hypothetical protein